MSQESTAPVEMLDAIEDDDELRSEYEAVTHVSDARDAAELVFERLERAGRLRALIGPLAHAITNHRRNRVRLLEHAVVAEAEEAAAEATRDRRPARGGRRVMPTLSQLLGERFYTGRQWVAYAEATPADFRASVDYLRAKVDGIRATIAFRSMCAQVIEAHPGAETLADVPDEVLADVLAHRA